MLFTLTDHDTRAGMHVARVKRERRANTVKFTDAIRIDAAAGVAEASLYVPADADYLTDHFPGFPMLPGLIMLEAAVRAAAALWTAQWEPVRLVAALDYVRDLHILRRVAPGETLILQARADQAAARKDIARFAARGEVQGQPALRARFQLRAVHAFDARHERPQPCRRHEIEVPR